MIFIFWSGELLENCSQISQRIRWQIFFCDFFGLGSPGLQAPKLSPPKFPLKIIGIPLHFQVFEPKIISRQLLLTGRPKIRKPPSLDRYCFESALCSSKSLYFCRTMPRAKSPGKTQTDIQLLCSFCHLDLSRNSRILDAKSRLRSANLG